MKLRVPGDQRFPGFRDAQIPTHVLYEGNRFPRCIAVDTGSGVGWRNKADAEGNVVVVNDEPVVERIFGSFRVA